MAANPDLISKEATNIDSLFDGPTLIRIARPANGQGIFREINYAVHRDSPAFSDYVEAKVCAKRIYVKNFSGEKYVDHVSVLEPHDGNSVIVYSRDCAGDIESVLRLCLDKGHGMPLNSDLVGLVAAFRRQGLTIAEPGRFVSRRSAGMALHLVSAAFEIALHSGIDVYLMQCRVEHCDFYRSRLGAEVLRDYPPPEGCRNMAWKVSATPTKFAQYSSSNRTSLKELFTNNRRAS
jgi:hypothetical protein